MVFKYQVSDMIFVFILAMGTVAGCSNARSSNDNRPHPAPIETAEPTQSPTLGDRPGINSVQAIALPHPIAPSGQPLGPQTPGVTPSPRVPM